MTDLQQVIEVILQSLGIEATEEFFAKYHIIENKELKDILILLEKSKKIIERYSEAFEEIKKYIKEK